MDEVWEMRAIGSRRMGVAEEQKLRSRELKLYLPLPPHHYSSPRECHATKKPRVREFSVDVVLACQLLGSELESLQMPILALLFAKAMLTTFGKQLQPLVASKYEGIQ